MINILKTRVAYPWNYPFNIQRARQLNELVALQEDKEINTKSSYGL